MPIIAVVGSKKSGKTTAVEVLVKGFAEKGYRIATVKHIPDPDFSLDTQGKDTWRHRQAGAFATLSVAPNELALIERADTTKYELSEIVNYIEDEAEIVILEGFRHLTAHNPDIPKVVAVKTASEVREAIRFFNPITAFVGECQTGQEGVSTPYIDACREPERLVELMEKKVGSMIRKKQKPKAAITIRIDGRQVTLSPFVQRFMRTVILSMISQLRNVTVNGDETVHITTLAGSE